MDSPHLFLGLLTATQQSEDDLGLLVATQQGEDDLGLLVATQQGEDDFSSLLLLADVSREAVRLYVEASLDPSPDSPVESPRLTKLAKRTLELAADEARRLSDHEIGAEHMLLAMMRQPKTPLGEALLAQGLDLGELRTSLKGLHRPLYPAGNPLNGLGNAAKHAIDRADELRRASFCGRIGVLHLLLAVLEDEGSMVLAALRGAMVEAGTAPQDLRQAVRGAILSDGEMARAGLRFSSDCRTALDRAGTIAKTHGCGFIGPEHILAALLPRNHNWGERLWAPRVAENPAAQILGDFQVQECMTKTGFGIEAGNSVLSLRKFSPGKTRRPAWHCISGQDRPPAGANSESIWRRVTGTGRRALFHAHAIALERGEGVADTTHFFLGLLAVTEGGPENLSSLLLSCGVQRHAARLKVEASMVKVSAAASDEPWLSPTWKETLEFAADEARLLGVHQIGPEHMLLGLVRQPAPAVGEVLRELGLDLNFLRASVKMLHYGSEPVPKAVVGRRGDSIVA